MIWKDTASNILIDESWSILNQLRSPPADEAKVMITKEIPNVEKYVRNIYLIR